jgi:hypothetical protein
MKRLAMTIADRTCIVDPMRFAPRQDADTTRSGGR